METGIRERLLKNVDKTYIDIINNKANNDNIKECKIDDISMYRNKVNIINTAANEQKDKFNYEMMNLKSILAQKNKAGNIGLILSIVYFILFVLILIISAPLYDLLYFDLYPLFISIMSFFSILKLITLVMSLIFCIIGMKKTNNKSSKIGLILVGIGLLLHFL